MNKKDIDTTQKQYEELGYKIKDIQFQQTKINNNKPSSTNNSQTNNFLEENVKQSYLNLTLMEEESQVLSILKNLKSRHNEIEQILGQKENEKNAIMEDINILTQRLKMLDKSICKKKNFYEGYDKTLKDAENAFNKINESTKTLLSVVKKENLNLTKISGLK
jgi:Sjoegren syndrome nuclear autoantigen 1